MEHFDIFNIPKDIQAITVFNGEDPVGLYGLDHKRNGVAEGWLYRSELVENNKFIFFKYAKKFCDYAVSKYNLHRLEIAVSKSDAKWAQKLGFKFESVMEKWSEEREDYLRYVRIK